MFLFFFSLETLFKSEDGKNQEAKAAAAAKASKVGISKSWNIGETKLKKAQDFRMINVNYVHCSRFDPFRVTILVLILATSLTKEPDNFEERPTFDTGAIHCLRPSEKKKKKIGIEKGRQVVQSQWI